MGETRPCFHYNNRTLRSFETMTEIEDSNHSNIPSKAALDVAMAATAGLSNGVKGTVQDVWGGLIGDRVRQWRQRNLISVLEKTAVCLKESGISLEKAKALPDGALYSLFENSSKAEEADLQAMWANLMAKEMSENPNYAKLERFVKTLSDMTLPDVRLFKLTLLVPKMIDEFFRVWSERQRECEDLHRSADEVERNSIFNAMIDEYEREGRAFLNELNALIEREGFTAEDQIEISKHSLLRLGLISRSDKSMTQRHLTHFNFRAASIFGDFESKVEKGFRDLKRSVDDFETWATSKITENEAVWLDRKSGGRISANYEPTTYGIEFAKSVGEMD
ncbi:MAG: Abi-alpha family protein [Pseudomonadota bacterium]